MNLLIIESDRQCVPNERSQLNARQHEHVVKTLKLGVGDSLAVGQLNGKVGTALITEQAPSHTTIELVHLNDEPPPVLPLELIIGLPRPRMLQRILQTAATMGVSKIRFVQTSKVEKSFWQTPLLKPESVHQNLILGLEQGKATQLPEVLFNQRFRPFAEDVLPELSKNYPSRVVAHPGPYPVAEPQKQAPVIAAIGPEGGFSTKEFDAFLSAGFKPAHLGARILRVETALPVLLAKLF